MGVVVVANPTAGRGKGAKLIPGVDALLRSLGVSHTLRICEGPEDPERFARLAATDGAEIVAALGGDGQVGACANGVMGTDSALAVIPAGTGNDFARHLGLDRKDPLAAVRLLAAPMFKRIDAVKVTTPERERYYVNIGGAGFDSEVNEHANKVRRLQGTAKYVYSTFVTLARFAAGEFIVKVDGEDHPFKGMMLAVGNATSYGGGMRVTPDARSDDGLLDVCVIQELPKWQFVKAFSKVFSGKHVQHPAVTMLRGKQIEISADRPFQVYADGEPVGCLPATFSVIPSALRVVVPPGPGRGEER
jgi:YegS/Rv2252/BmrU family lipid kinase